MSRVLLCNPPAERPTMRDYYCSSTSKAGYAWQPIDLLVQAAWLRDEHELIWRDFAVTSTSREKALAQIVADKPQIIVGLVGAASPDDFLFWQEVVQRTEARLFLSGDLVRFTAEQTLTQYDFIEGVFLDFIAAGLRDHLRGLDFHPGLALRGDQALHLPEGDFAYPLPPYELVWTQPYRHPFLASPFATVMTDHGCVHRCAYCNSGRVNYRRRDLTNLAEELAWLQRHRVRELFVKDMTFNADPKRTREVLALLVATGPWRFICYIRPDRLDDEQARALAKAGCAMAMAGIESGSDAVLAQVRENATVEKTTAGIQALHRAGITVGGHFLFGLPDEDEKDLGRTLDLALHLPLAYASFNLAAPRLGTPLYRIGEGIADGSSADTRLLSDQLDRTVLLAWRKKAMRKFYTRPGYLLRRLTSSLRQGSLTREFRHGLALLADD